MPSLRKQKFHAASQWDRDMNIIFDIGMVLITWDPKLLYRKIFNDEAKAEWFLSNICTMDWNLEQDRGRSFAEAVKYLSALHPTYAEAIAAYDIRWHETVPGAIAGTVDILESLHKRSIPLFAITNFNQDKFRETKLRFPFLNLFRDIVVSGEEKLVKPDAAIFDLCLKRNGLLATECLFIDDSLKNVKGALAMGMKAHHFTTPKKLKGELQQLGVL
jgi:2-haloacid dehalogenase